MKKDKAYQQAERKAWQVFGFSMLSLAVAFLLEIGRAHV